MQFADEEAAKPEIDIVEALASVNKDEGPIEVIRVNDKTPDLQKVDNHKKHKHNRLSMLFCGINKKV